MNTEEKAKAYDEVLERVKPLYEWAKKDDSPMWSTYEYLFPQLAESEDDRIRKFLIEMFSHGTWQKEWPFGPNEIVAWLEKQKEHRETCTTFLAKILKHSAEGFRNVLKKKGINYIPHESFWTNTAGTFSKQECNEFYKWMDDLTMELVTEETPEYKKGFKDGLDASKKEQKTEKYGLQKESHYTKRNALFDECVKNCDPEVMKNVSEKIDAMLEKEQKHTEPSDDELKRHQDELYDFKVFAAKQAKEHHISFVHDFEWNNFCDELLSYFNEQKPVEYLSKEKVYDIMRNLTALSYSQRIPINSDEYEWIHKITEDVRSLLDYPVEQKPVQSDVEKEYIRTIKGIIADFIRDKKPGDVEFYQRIVDWLDGRHIEQKPAERNTNDKAFIKDCAHILDENGYAASAERLLSMFPIKPAEWSEEQPEIFDTVAFQKGVQEGRRLERDEPVTDCHDLTNAAENSWVDYEYRESPKGLYSTCYVDGFIAGAEWQLHKNNKNVE